LNFGIGVLATLTRRFLKPGINIGLKRGAGLPPRATLARPFSRRFVLEPWV
jgi:hypothetical protein